MFIYRSIIAMGEDDLFIIVEFLFIKVYHIAMTKM